MISIYTKPLTLLVVYLSTCLAYANEFGNPPLNPKDVTFWLHSSENSYKELTVESVDSSFVAPGKKTFIVIGRFDMHRSTLAQSDKDNLPKCNMIVVNWTPLTGSFSSVNRLGELHELYNNATTYIPVIGQEIVKLLRSLKTKKNIAFSQVHVIGFGLGAQIGAVVGLEVNKQYHEKLGRISGLDPASSYFQEANITAEHRLDKTDAKFVDIYYTNRRIFGSNNVNIGHANFYINLIECANDAKERIYSKNDCNQPLSWRFWTLALKNDIRACPCKVEASENESSCTDWSTSSCDSPVRAGLFISRTTRGNYFVTITNAN